MTHHRLIFAAPVECASYVDLGAFGFMDHMIRQVGWAGFVRSALRLRDGRALALWTSADGRLAVAATKNDDDGCIQLSIASADAQAVLGLGELLNAMLPLVEVHRDVAPSVSRSSQIRAA